MIGLYADRVIETELPLLVPICEAIRPNVVPYVDESLRCVMTALRTAYSAIAIRTKNKVLVRMAQEIRPDLNILVDGLTIRGRKIRPLLRPGAGIRGYYLVEDAAQLAKLDARIVEGLFVRADAFNPRWIEEALRGRLKCDRCTHCAPAELLLCDAYKELEVL